MGLTRSHRQAAGSRGFLPSTETQPPRCSAGLGAGHRLQSCSGAVAGFCSPKERGNYRQSTIIPCELGQFIKQTPTSSNKLSLLKINSWQY